MPRRSWASVRRRITQCPIPCAGPSGRPRPFQSVVNGVRPDKPSYAVTFRFKRPDGREMWLEETSRAEFDAAGRYLRLKGLSLDITERSQAEEHQGG